MPLNAIYLIGEVRKNGRSMIDKFRGAKIDDLLIFYGPIVYWPKGESTFSQRQISNHPRTVCDFICVFPQFRQTFQKAGVQYPLCCFVNYN